MRRHVEYSEEILSQLKDISPITVHVAIEHHERWDGSGYSKGKKGNEISLSGQMASIVDVYDAISVDRVYHKGMEPNDALKKLMQWSGHHFEPTLAQHFVQCVGIYPVGTMVELSNGQLAIVVASSSEGLLHPLVRIVYDRPKRRFITPRLIDLSDQPEEEGFQQMVRGRTF